MSLSLDRQNRVRAQYAKSHPGWRPATTIYEELIRAYLKPGTRLLDLGCGRGGVLEQLGDAVSHPLGFDPDPRSLAEHRIATLPRAAALADRLPLRDQSLDCIVCSWVLEHVADPARVFAEVARCLRLGGVFIFLTPNARAFMSLINQLLHPLQHILVPRLYGRAEVDTFPVLYRANSKTRLDAFAAQAGLSPEQFRLITDPSYLAFNPALYTISQLISRVTPPVHLVGVYRRRTIP